MTLDGVGEWSTTSFGVGRGNKISCQADLRFPHSLGLLYSAFTYYTGFKVNSGEYKLMGLAPYGEPIYKETIYDHLIEVKTDGSFRMNMEYFDYCAGLRMTNGRFSQLFGGPPRKPESPLTQREMDLARSVQEVCEEIVLTISGHIQQTTGMNQLCLAGGVALNCVANGKLLRADIFEDIWIQPAAGDAGGALGAALFGWYQHFDNPRNGDDRSDSMQGAYLGPSYNDTEIERFLRDNSYSFKKLTNDELYDSVADLIAEEQVVGWFQGRMEFGPRALGARSILGDARSARMQKTMNLKIKFREGFRPFAPSIRAENISDYFELERESPYMLIVANVNRDKRLPITEEQKTSSGLDKLYVIRSEVPAVTHVDCSARIQSVHEETNPRYHRLLTTFNQRHGCPLVVNTSFNVRGEPIVCTPKDAYLCFMRTEMDYLVLGNYLLNKDKQQPLTDDVDWQETFELD